MRISVVISTYNGEKFIGEQLDSILKQTRLADEIIIVDDCSSDGTTKILDEYSSNEKSIRAYLNRENKGWKRNFHDAIKKANGEIIVLCDQDDIWYADKLETIETILTNHPEIDLLASEFDELENGVVKKKERKESLTQVLMNERLIHTYYPGCTYAFRRILFDKADVVWDDTLPHDAQLGIAAKIFHSMYIYGNPLIIYRRHSNNATKRTAPSLKKKREFIKAERAYITFAQHLIVANKKAVFDESKANKILAGTTGYLNNRELLLSGFHPKGMIRAVRNIKYYYSNKTCLGDIVFGLKNKGE